MICSYYEEELLLNWKGGVINQKYFFKQLNFNSNEEVMLVKRMALLCVMMIAASLVYAKTIALVQINQQAQFFTDMNRGAEAEAAKLGHKLVIFNANNDPAAQNNAIETYIQQKVDGLIVVAIDTNGIMPAVIQAANAGIPVVAVDAILPDGPHIAQVVSTIMVLE